MLIILVVLIVFNLIVDVQFFGDHDSISSDPLHQLIEIIFFVIILGIAMVFGAFVGNELMKLVKKRIS